MSKADALLDRFCDALWLEQGLAQNTLASYRRDLTQFSVWLGEHEKKSLIECDRADIQTYYGARERGDEEEPHTTGRSRWRRKRY